MDKYFNALQGITHTEWIKVKMAVDQSFDKSIRELKSNLQIANADALKKSMQSHFGK